MRSDMRDYWRDPGYWRWLWRDSVRSETKSAIAAIALTAVAFGIGGYWVGKAEEPREVEVVTTERVVTVVPATPANAPSEVVTKSRTPTQPAAVRMVVLSVTPGRPRAARPFELVARVGFVPAPGSIRCSVWIGGERYRKVQLTLESSIARCFFRVPEGAGGKRLQIGLSAVLGGSNARTTRGFRIS